MKAKKKSKKGKRPRNRRASRRIDEKKLHEVIKSRAYVLWEAHGRPSDSDLDIWLQAERDMIVE